MKTIFFTLFISCLALFTQAQETRGKSKIKVKFGGRGGVNSSFMRSNPGGYSVNSQIGFNAGVYATITGIWKKLYIQPGVDYYFNSYRYTRTLDDRDDKVKTHTIQVPVTAGYTIIQSSRLLWNINTGPMASILVGVSENDFDDQVNRDFYKPVVWSWRTETYLRIGRITVNAGFDAGMSKLYDDGSDIRPHTWYGGIGLNL